MKNFSEYLLNEKILSREKLREIQTLAYENNRTFFKELKVSGALTEEKITKAAAGFFGMRLIAEDDISIALDFEGTKAICQLTEFENAEAFAVFIDSERFFVINDPESSSLIEKIKVNDSNAKFALCTRKTAKKIHRRIVQPALIQFQAEKLKNESAAFELSMSENSDAMRLFHQLLRGSLAERASDLQIIPLADRAEVSMRIDGQNRPYTTIPLNVAETLKNILINQAQIGNVQPGAPIAGKMRYDGIDVRINIIPSRMGSDINLRFLSSKIYTFDQLGISGNHQKTLNRLFRMTKGLVVFVGPTGSGKSTTMYAGLALVKDSGRKICAAEDPVEILLPGVTQIDVSKSLTYAGAVQSFLRHDSDIIVIGETRSEEVAAQVLRAAETGQLTFTTLHTNDALSAVSRLVGLKVDPYILGSTLAAVVSQRLVRRVCTHCAEEYGLPQNHEWREIFKLGGEKIKLKRGVGCAECNGTGYFGRIAINEIVTSNSEFASAVQRLASRAELEKIVQKSEHKSLLSDGIEKALNGVTTFDELTPFVNDII